MDALADVMIDGRGPTAIDLVKEPGQRLANRRHLTGDRIANHLLAYQSTDKPVAEIDVKTLHQTSSHGL